jgi:hypothetical protein
MPLPQPESERIWLSALAYLRQSGGVIDSHTLARMIWRRDYDREIINNFAAVAAVVRRASQAFSLAGQYGPEGDVAPDGSAYPVDPGARPEEGQYHYRVVVEVTDGTNMLADGAVTITANMSLTANEIHDLAVDTILSDSSERGYRNTIGGAMTADNQVNVYVISAARAF